MAKGRAPAKDEQTPISVDRVEAAERELRDLRRAAARRLREERARVGLSLREVGRRVKLSAPVVYNTEAGNTWETKTARKLERFYAQQVAAADEAQAA